MTKSFLAFKYLIPCDHIIYNAMTVRVFSIHAVEFSLKLHSDILKKGTIVASFHCYRTFLFSQEHSKLEEYLVV